MCTDSQTTISLQVKFVVMSRTVFYYYVVVYIKFWVWSLQNITEKKIFFFLKWPNSITGNALDCKSNDNGSSPFSVSVTDFDCI